MSTAQGLHSIRLILANLPEAVNNGDNLEARYKMQIAATMAGWAFSTGPSTLLAHTISHVIGARYHTNHGAVCGIALAETMRFNRDYTLDQLE
ncbi:MAG: iron-containing alcohol dehydrogenase [Spirochaetia bacterium]